VKPENRNNIRKNPKEFLVVAPGHRRVASHDDNVIFRRLRYELS
jgi:hypothetical protein